MSRILPLAGSAEASPLDAVLTSVHVHIALQAVAWGAFFVFCLIRFRRKANPAATYRGLKPILPWLAIGAVVVGDAVLLATSALPAWLERSTPPDPAAAPLEVHIAAEQFAWNVHYPGPDGRFGLVRAALIGPANPVGIDRTDPAARDDIGVLNTLTVPVGRPVIVTLTARDVIHSFTVNEMRVKQDATPGLTVRTWFTPIATGTFDIRCSQLCGLGHYRMRGDLAVLPVAMWEQWQRSELALIRPTPRS